MRALENTAQSMNQTRDVLGRSEHTMGALVSELGSLREPMKNLAALRGPLQNLGSLGTNVDQLGARMQGVETNLQRLEKPLQNVAALEGPLDRVRMLEKPLQTIASVGQDRTKMGLIVLAMFATWLLLTFLAVYGGFVAALRRISRPRRTARRKI